MVVEFDYKVCNPNYNARVNSIWLTNEIVVLVK